MTDADRHLRDLVSADGVHVVHVWAPWCDNSLHELEPVWSHDAGADSVTFVTVWNDGQSGADALERHGVTGLGQGVTTEIVVAGSKPEKAGRRMMLLGLPVTWIPTTWVFNRGGLLATAFNHGEITRGQLAEAINNARADW